MNKGLQSLVLNVALASSLMQPQSSYDSHYESKPRLQGKDHKVRSQEEKARKKQHKAKLKARRNRRSKTRR